MKSSHAQRKLTFTATLAIFALQSGFASAATPPVSFYDMALCKPPYTLASATDAYNAAETLAKPDMSKFGSAIYKLPKPIGRDGFESNEVIIGGTMVGVLVSGQRAQELAAKYQLKPDDAALLNTATKSYARVLPPNLQPPAGLSGTGKVSVIARESQALPGKTILGCEFVPD